MVISCNTPIRRVLGIRCLMAAFISFCAGSSIAMESPPVEITSVTIGFDGLYKVGTWTPVVVHVAGAEQLVDARIDVIVPDGDGLPVTYLDEHPAGGEYLSGQALVYVKFGRVRGDLEVRIVQEQTEIVARKFSAAEIPDALPADQQLVVHLGADIGVEHVLPKLDRDDVHIVRLEPGLALPDRWWSYEGVDSLILTTGAADLGQWISEEQADAILHWVRMGGQVILSAGRQGHQLFGEGGWMKDFVPGTFQDVVDQCQTTGLENFTDTSYPIVIRRDTSGKCELALTVVDDLKGQVQVWERSAGVDRPMIVRHCHGFGQLVFVAVDLDVSPIAEWQGRDQLLVRLLEWTLDASSAPQRAGSGGAVRHAGYVDLAGQLRNAMEHFSQVTFIPFWFVAALMVAYLLLVGPVDYFFLKRVIGRMEWTWLTFPFVVVGFSVGAYALAQQLKGNSLRVNQVDIIDVDGREHFVRGTTWSHAISPTTEIFDISVRPDIPSKSSSVEQGETLLSWQGLPGESLGGMNSASAIETSTGSYVIRNTFKQDRQQSEIEGMPIQIWSTKAFQSRWWLPIDLGSLGKIRARADGQLRGQVRNPLDEDLSDCYLYYAPWAYQLGKISAGRTALISSTTVRRNLHWRLTRRTLSEVSDLTTPWDQYSRDIPRIIEIMMFHELAGGETYTGLQNRYQAFVDMSHHLTVGQAVFVGRSERPATQMIRDGEPLVEYYDKHWSFYRFIVPVESMKSARVSDRSSEIDKSDQQRREG